MGQQGWSWPGGVDILCVCVRRCLLAARLVPAPLDCKEKPRHPCSWEGFGLNQNLPNVSRPKFPDSGLNPSGSLSNALSVGQENAIFGIFLFFFDQI